MRRSRELVALAAAALLASGAASGCAHPKPRPPVVASAPAPEPPPPPPPPKCEALSEACAATAETRARVAGTKLALRPPRAWTYAQEESATIAQHGKAALVVLAVPAPDAKRLPRGPALEAVIARLDVKFPKSKAKPKPKKAERVLTVGDRKVSLFQLDGAVRDGSKGPVLVFETADGAGAYVVGGGFVPDDDTSNADAEILSSIESLAPGAGAP